MVLKYFTPRLMGYGNCAANRTLIDIDNAFKGFLLNESFKLIKRVKSIQIAISKPRQTLQLTARILAELGWFNVGHCVHYLSSRWYNLKPSMNHNT